MLTTSNWQYAYGQPKATALFKQLPEDFQVTEELGYSFSNEGEHQFLWVEKTLANTAWVAEQLAKFTGLPLRNVTYAGRKDKYAVTRQWFGLHAPGKADFDFSTLDIEGVKVLEQHRHNRKLRTGQLKGNRFRITLRQVTDAKDLLQRLTHVSHHGVPNYFGEQRFGIVRTSETGERLEGGNLQLAGRMLAGETIRNRNKRNMALSALRSWLFNEVLSHRVSENKLDTILSGDAVMLSGSHSFFVDTGEDATLPTRYQQQDLAPTAPLWGRGTSPCVQDALALETEVTSQHQELCTFLENEGLKHERRSAKIWPQQLEWQHEGDTVILSFSLPSGCYATTVLRECVAMQTADSATD